MGEAILMGCQDASVSAHDYSANKVPDAATLADLVVSTNCHHQNFTLHKVECKHCLTLTGRI